jgi:hypothetical protein
MSLATSSSCALTTFCNIYTSLALLVNISVNTPISAWAFVNCTSKVSDVESRLSNSLDSFSLDFFSLFRHALESDLICSVSVVSVD